MARVLQVVIYTAISDKAKLAAYAKLAGPAIAQHGGHFIARAGRYVQLEGKDRPRNVVAKFPSLEAAEACYHSSEYQAALEYARSAAERELVIVETTE